MEEVFTVDAEVSPSHTLTPTFILHFFWAAVLLLYCTKYQDTRSATRSAQHNSIVPFLRPAVSHATSKFNTTFARWKLQNEPLQCLHTPEQHKTVKGILDRTLVSHNEVSKCTKCTVQFRSKYLKCLIIRTAFWVPRNWKNLPNKPGLKRSHLCGSEWEGRSNSWDYSSEGRYSTPISLCWCSLWKVHVASRFPVSPFCFTTWPRVHKHTQSPKPRLQTPRNEDPTKGGGTEVWNKLPTQKAWQ